MFPALTDWNTTRDGLHTVAQVVGRIRKSFIPPQPNALHLSLFVTPDGISSGPILTKTGTHTVEAHFGDGQIHASFARSPFPTTQDGLTALIAAAEAESEQGLREGDTPPAIAIDPSLAADYARVQYAMYTALARFRATLGGRMTPLVLWPHHFDLSFLYFVGGKGDEHNDPHMNFGFAPYSDTIDRPYLYMYGWPMPDGLEGHALPEPAEWVTAGWQGVMVDYDKLIAEADPQAVVESVCRGLFQLFASQMDKS